MPLEVDVLYNCAAKYSGLKLVGQIEHRQKLHSRTDYESPEGEQGNSSTLSLTSVLYGSGWSTTSRGSFTPRRETRCALYSRLGEPYGRSGRVREHLAKNACIFISSTALFVNSTLRLNVGEVALRRGE
jgi:hypothetical protein